MKPTNKADADKPDLVTGRELFRRVIEEAKAREELDRYLGLKKD